MTELLISKKRRLVHNKLVDNEESLSKGQFSYQLYPHYHVCFNNGKYTFRSSDPKGGNKNDTDKK